MLQAASVTVSSFWTAAPPLGTKLNEPNATSVSAAFGFRVIQPATVCVFVRSSPLVTVRAGNV